MSRTATIDTPQLIGMLDEAVQEDDTILITQRVQDLLSDLCRSGTLRLPERLCQPRAECYARRLLHRDDRLGYTAVVMTWGPGQRTPLHDHAGIWCVEGVFEGEMNVSRYNVTEHRDDLFRFKMVEQVRAGVGTSGSLIPPFEYHVLENALSDGLSITLHVYGGEMDHCCVYEPRDDGWFQRRQKQLTYIDG